MELAEMGGYPTHGRWLFCHEECSNFKAQIIVDCTIQMSIQSHSTPQACEPAKVAWVKFVETVT